MKKRIPYSLHTIDSRDESYVLKTLRRGFLTQGPRVAEFEKALAAYCGAKYAVTFSNGTSALHAAYSAAGIKAGDEILTTPISFASTANAALFLGAKPVFSDVEADTVNLDPGKAEKLISSKTKAIVPVDFAGHPVRLKEFRDLTRKHKLCFIEDACHALGAEYQGKKIGAFADITVFSFHPAKVITTGEGGACLTNDKTLSQKLIRFRHHGILRKDPARPWNYEMQTLGCNYRLSDLQCALGLSQLAKIEAFLARRREIAEEYQRALAEVEELELPLERPGVRSAWHLFVVRIRRDKVKKKKEEILRYLFERGIGVQVHYLPIPWHPYYRGLGYSRTLCPVACDYFERAFSIPLYPTLKKTDIRKVVSVLKQSLR